MTFYASRYNIEPMCFGISFMVMVFLCLVRAIITRQVFRHNEFTSCNSTTYSTSCFDSFGIAGSGMNFTSSTCSFVFFALVVAFLSYFTFFTLLIAPSASLSFLCLTVFFDLFQPAYFATTSISIFALFVFVKFRQWLEFFALGTYFRYDGFRHNCFLNKQFCLEPITAHTVIGLF